MIEYRIIEAKKLVWCTGEGSISFNELITHIEELASDPCYLPPMKKLIDYRRAHLAALSVEESRNFTDRKVQLKHRFGGERCALVVAHDVDFGMSRVHVAHVDPAGIETSVFRNMDDALRWLDVSLDEDDIALR